MLSGRKLTCECYTALESNGVKDQNRERDNKEKEEDCDEEEEEGARGDGGDSEG